MAHHKSAIKRIRRNDSANIRNHQYLTTVRTAVKRFRLAVSSVAAGTLDKSTVNPLFVKAQALLAKAANKGIIHKNNASRKIGRLSKLLKTLDGGPIATATPPKTKKSAAAPKKEAAPKVAAKVAPKAEKAEKADKPAAKAAPKKPTKK